MKKKKRQDKRTEKVMNEEKWVFIQNLFRRFLHSKFVHWTEYAFLLLLLCTQLCSSTQSSYSFVYMNPCHFTTRVICTRKTIVFVLREKEVKSKNWMDSQYLQCYNPHFLFLSFFLSFPEKERDDGCLSVFTSYLVYFSPFLILHNSLLKHISDFGLNLE